MRKDLLILLLTLLPAIAWLVQPGFFPMHDDLQPMRQLEMEKCIHDLQIPCRWVLDMGYGYGYPLFNFYPPLPYYVGGLVRVFGFSFVDTVKIVGILAFAITTLGMYLLGREFWGRSGGFVSSLFYTYAPYHSVDFYVRAAVNEFWALALFPYVFWFSYKLIQTRKSKWIPCLAISVACLMLSHNPSLMIFVPGFMLWIFFWVVKSKNFKSILPLSLAAVWAFGLAAFFTLPVVFEQKYVSVWTLTSGYFNYLAHFLNLNQMFFRINWGYGSSILGPDDTMSFAIGYLQWIIPAVILLLMVFIKKLRVYWLQALLLVSLAIVSLFMTHSKATPIWMVLKPLEFLQFPWRFLTLVIFYLSFVSGSIALVLNKKLIAFLLMLVLLLNANYLRPRDWWPTYGDMDRFTGRNWQLMLTSSIFDYLPIWAPFPPADQASGDINLITGIGTSSTLVKRTNLQKYALTVNSPSATAQLETYYFPGWKIWLDGQPQIIDPGRDKLLGRMQVDLPQGDHQIIAKFTNTPIRTLGNILSLFAWGSLVGIGIIRLWPKDLHPGTST